MTKTIDRSDTAIPPGSLIIEKVPPRILVRRIKNGLTRRRFLAGTGSLLLLEATGCGGGGGDQSGSGETRIIEHKFGAAEIPENPERMVTVGFNETDFVLGLGVVLVGATGAGTRS